MKIIKYGKAPGGYDFTGQQSFSVTNLKHSRINKSERHNRYWTETTGYNTLGLHEYGWFTRKVKPGDTVYTIEKNNGIYKVRKDIIVEIFTFGYCKNKCLYQIWLKYGGHNSGLSLGEHCWLTKNQAQYALSKLNRFNDDYDWMIYCIDKNKNKNKVLTFY